MPIDELTYWPRATTLLAEHLRAGTLVLFLGAGASTWAGLPNWRVLVSCLRARVSLPVRDYPLDISADELQREADEVAAKYANDLGGFQTLVKGCLYEGVTLSPALFRDDLLRAFGALMMGSRRGSVSRVVTTNFDSVLEWFLTLHGYVPRVVSKQPALEGAEDVRIYHPHGFLPHPEMGLPDGDVLILGIDAVNKRLGTLGDPWFELTRRMLQTSVGLFVGLSVASFRDRALAPLLAKVGEQVKHERPTGFWVLTSAENHGVTEEMLRQNIVPVYCPEKGELPERLLQICRAAASAVLV